MKERIKKIKLKYIFWFYLIFSVYAVIRELFLIPETIDESNLLFVRLSHYFNFFYVDFSPLFEFLGGIRVIDSDYKYYNGQNRLIYPFLIITASLIFFFTKFKDSKLLRFALSFLIPFIILYQVFNLSVGIVYSVQFKIDLPTRIFLPFFIAIIKVFVLCITIARLNMEDLDSLEVDKKGVVVNSSKGTRFINYIIDSILRLILVFIFIALYLNLNRFVPDLFDFDGNEYFFRFVLLLTAILLLYFPLESLFLRSPAKFLTNSKVEIKEEYKFNISYITLRTLIRMIPIFDIFSFLILPNGEGLHDKGSNTRVIKNRANGISSSWYLLIIPIIIILPFAPRLYNGEMDKLRKKESYTQYRENEKERFLKKLERLKKNDVIVDNNYLSDYYIVDKVDGNYIYTTKLKEEEYKKFENKRNNDITYNLNDFRIDYDLDKTNDYFTESELDSISDLEEDDYYLDELEDNYNSDELEDDEIEFEKIKFTKNEIKKKQDIDYQTNEIIRYNVPNIKEIDLFTSSSTIDYKGVQVKSYDLKFELEGCPCILNYIKVLKGNISFQAESNYSEINYNGFSKEIDNTVEKLGKEENIIEISLSKSGGESVKYHILLNKYGVYNFYTIDD